LTSSPTMYRSGYLSENSQNTSISVMIHHSNVNEDIFELGLFGCWLVIGVCVCVCVCVRVCVCLPVCQSKDYRSADSGGVASDCISLKVRQETSRGIKVGRVNGKRERQSMCVCMCVCGVHIYE